jgi:hypothetical protein
LHLGPILAALDKVAVWTSNDGQWQEYGSFLLRTTGGRWVEVCFSSTTATKVFEHLVELLSEAGMKTLFDLLTVQDQRIVLLWDRKNRTCQ